MTLENADLVGFVYFKNENEIFCMVFFFKLPGSNFIEFNFHSLTLKAVS